MPLRSVGELNHALSNVRISKNEGADPIRREKSSKPSIEATRLRDVSPEIRDVSPEMM